MTLIPNKRAVGVFSSRREVENALNELRDHGFAMNHVSVIAKDADTQDLNPQDRISETRVKSDTQHRTSERRDQSVTDTTHVDEGAKTGLGAGGAVGGITGLLVGLGTLAIPGVGPIMLAGATATAIATTLAGGAIGAAVGGLIGGLVGLGIPEERAKVYQDQVVSGDYLVIVDGTEAEILRAERIFRSKGVREWDVYNPPAIKSYADPAVSHL
ncbi:MULTISPECIES: general stress protein [unclassified Anabaena]|jgi:hypothetical protein|uniref:general stress protein n=1 Tax=unclassified Anabaena TaxID=2619674 RepID=UPI0014473336|nr:MULTISPECIES: general stress protein [unclassified Anabaena]MTJ08541.1 signal transduction histidine kinase (STHK), LytS [Anabaena sp. UHCC 0204]MTJ53789.1 signal transduction histidine kinase (STHK), LytS [Anabaena sp. UHCC 0253]